MVVFTIISFGMVEVVTGLEDCDGELKHEDSPIVKKASKHPERPADPSLVERLESAKQFIY